MNRFLQAAWTAFALAGAVCFSTIAYKASKIPQIPDVTPLVHHGDGVLTRLEGIESKANATLINVDKATAVWAGSASDQAATVKTLAQNAVITLQEARGAIGEVHVAVTTANEQEAHIGPLLDSLKATSDSAQPVLGQLALTTAASTRLVDGINGRVRDPLIDKLMEHIEGTVEHVDGITGSLDKMGAHIEKKVDAPRTRMDRVEEWGGPIAKLVIWYFTK